jgi:hypothetical protein
MDDLIQVLFFVLTFALFIYSAIRKQKKPNRQVKPIDNVLESFLGIPLENEPIKTEEQQQYNLNIFENKVSIVDNQTDTKQEANLAKEMEPEEFNYQEPPFDLRSAVIYSEILNRRTY